MIEEFFDEELGKMINSACGCLDQAAGGEDDVDLMCLDIECDRVLLRLVSKELEDPWGVAGVGRDRSAEPVWPVEGQARFNCPASPKERWRAQ